MNTAWTEVMARAGDRCECSGECGRSHKRAGGRCEHFDAPGRSLNAVPRNAVPTHVVVTLSASELLALCGPCYDALARARKTERAAAALDDLNAGTLF